MVKQKGQLKNGYYVSAYCCIDPMFNVHQKAFRHDQNISLWFVENNKVKLLHHWELERITGIKHHKISFFNDADFLQLLDRLLEEYSLKSDELQGIFGLPNVSSIADYHSLDEYEDLSYHAMSHLFSSLLADSDIFYNHNIIALAIDGSPDIVIDKSARRKNHYVGAYAKKGEIEIFPVLSPGMYWVASTNKFSLAEGTLMALAYASKSESFSIKPQVDTLRDVYTYFDGIALNDEINELWDEISSYRDGDQGVKFNYFDERFTEEENKISMFMKIIQQISIMKIEKLLDDIIGKYNINPTETYISLSGGYTLNCPTNTHIMKKYKFIDQLYIPCVNDGGLSIGMGLYYFHKKINNIQFALKHPFYGDSDVLTENILQKYEPYINTITRNTDSFSQDMIKAPIIWFDNRAEIGPRALGHRSILADPRFDKSKDLLNVCKQRQWWRPVAPIVLEEYVKDWFEDSFSSPYMLNNFNIISDKKHLVPAILHMDDTCRVQTVNQDDNLLLYKCIQQFHDITGVPIICNTSLNDRGEPIINTISQAMNFALRKNIGIIYINGVRLELKNFNAFPYKHPEERWDELFTKYTGNTEMLKKLNLLNLTPMEYYIYVMNPSLHKFDYTKKEDAEQLKVIIARLNKKFKFDLFTQLMY